MAGIGLVGTSSTGKTTLASAVSETTGIAFVYSQARAVYRFYGLDINRPISIEQKLVAQRKLLEVSEMQYQLVNGLFVSDRTPIDFAAYMLAEAGAANLNDEQTQAVLAYVDDCIKAANLHFQSLILVQPAFKPTQEEGRPSNEAYLEHINQIMTGLIADPESRLRCPKHFMKKSIVDLNKRVEVVIRIASLVEAINMKQRLSAQVIH